MPTDVFLSHAHENADLALEIRSGLEERGLDVWLDADDIRVGVLLAPELRHAIEQTRALVLLWSQAAAASRWVQVEWLTAVHTQRFLIPCVVDASELPPCLAKGVWVDLRGGFASILPGLERGVRDAPVKESHLVLPVVAEGPEVKTTVDELWRAQKQVTDHLGRRQLAEARAAQSVLDPLQASADAKLGAYPRIANLSAYHEKNAYMLAHWHAIQAGQPPEDPHLAEAEHRFFRSLRLDPTDPSALNGIGNVFYFRRDFWAARYLCQWALDRAGGRYAAASNDLELANRALRHMGVPASALE